MATITKKEFIDLIAEQESCKRSVAKRVLQTILDTIVAELANGNRVEFRDFGVFECKVRGSREAQNPKTLKKVRVPPKRIVKFKAGRDMKTRMHKSPLRIDEATGLTLESAVQRIRRTAAAKQDGAVQR
jgi:nucleoid DNA-binding protein